MDLEIKIEKNIEVLARLNKGVHDLQQMWYPTIFKEYNYETIFKMFEEMLQKDYVYSLIAYSFNQPVGYIVLVVRNYDNPLFCENHKSIYIDQMCIIEEYRNKGVGKTMMEKVKEFTQAKGFIRIELSVWADNVNAIKFYERMGFTNYLHNMVCKVD